MRRGVSLGYSWAPLAAVSPSSSPLERWESPSGSKPEGPGSGPGTQPLCVQAPGPRGFQSWHVAPHSGQGHQEHHPRCCRGGEGGWRKLLQPDLSELALAESRPAGTEDKAHRRLSSGDRVRPAPGG